MSKANVAAERKNQIVSATVECITKYGYHNFSMQDVARLAGVSKGIIHYYFLNKDDLMMSVLDKVVGDIEKGLEKELKSASDAKAKLEIFIDVAFDIVNSTKEYYQVNMDFWTQINQKDDVRKIIAAHYAELRAFGEKIIREGMQEKVFNEVNAQQIAVMIISIVDGSSLQWLFDEEVIDLPQIKTVTKNLVFNYLIKVK